MTTYLRQSTSAAPLAMFRLAFGVLIFVSMVRFWVKGWIYDLYILPTHHFTFYGFEFVRPLGQYTYVLFAVCGLSAIFFAIGLFYRATAIVLFTSFTYIELIDKTTYLNHYYFVSMITLLMIFLPAHSWFSLDAVRNPGLRSERIPRWCLDSVKLFVAMIYFYAGLAKLNSDWLLHAMPLKMWLPSKSDVSIIGSLFNHEWVAYAFSWVGCIYDLSIPFLLWNKGTRLIAYIGVVVFHVLTAILFPIGMFPYIMMTTALIFFSPEFHQRVLDRIASLFRFSPNVFQSPREYVFTKINRSIVLAVIIAFFVVNLTFPFRYLLYPGELFWTEEGYRFSWRVMLMEKAGYAEFKVVSDDGRHVLVDNREFLTPLQEKMMSTQPDMILQYAHILRDHFAAKGFVSPKVYVYSYVALNGRLGKPLIDPKTDLAAQHDSFDHKKWILSFSDDIKGL
jgi:hypothetical protein